MNKRILAIAMILLSATAGDSWADGSRLKAAALSVLVPGAGQAYLGKTTSAETFFAVESKGCLLHI